MAYSSLPQKETVTDTVLTIIKGTGTDMMKSVIACIAVLANEIDKLKALEKEEEKEGNRK